MDSFNWFYMIEEPDPNNKIYKNLNMIIRTNFYFKNFTVVNELVQLWQMEDYIFSNCLQWVPNEILEDLINLVIDIEVIKQRYQESGRTLTTFSVMNTTLYPKEFLTLILKMKNISFENVDAIKACNLKEFNQEYQQTCINCNKKYVLTYISRWQREGQSFYLFCEECALTNNNI